MKNFKLIAMLVIVSLIASCSKDDAPKNSSAPNVLAVTTDTPSGITATDAVNPTIDDPANDEVLEMGTGVGAFSDTFTGFPSNSTGHIRAFATNANGTVYGENKTFTTLP